MENETKVESILSFLRGGNNIDLSLLSKSNPEILARCITYLLTSNYYRRNMCIAILYLLNQSPKSYRGIGWQLIQEIPLSHLLELNKIFENKEIRKKLNKKRLRHAISVKLAQTEKNQLLRTFFLKPNSYRNLFTQLFLPRELFKDKKITNENYKLAY
jgi:hypothetical protein